MGRLRALLHAQQPHATRNETAQLAVLHVAPPRECNTQQPENVTPRADSDQVTDARRQRVLALLAKRPSVRYAAITDLLAVPGSVTVTLAVRGAGTMELLIPADKWDGALFLNLIERHGATVH